MATTKQKLLLQHPSHQHPLELLDLSNETETLHCRLCDRKISAEAYTCQEKCKTYSSYYHRACVEAPSQIDHHPLHPFHSLSIRHCRSSINCDACGEHFDSVGGWFTCNVCSFNLDICCALSTLPDEGGSQGGKTSEQSTLPLHPHKLTSFSTRHDFVRGSDCNICEGSVEGDGYTCLRRSCEFVIHKRCIQDRNYADGTKAPRVYHGHPLEVFVGEDTGSNTCASCGSDKSGEFIGCATCEVFYHKHCFQVPEILRYPSHNPDHALVLFREIGTLQRECQSCSSSLEDEIYYRCTSCELFVHVGCAIQVLAYCEEGMSAKIKLSWHKHPLLLCHQTKYSGKVCFYCREDSIGPTYVCEEKDCTFLLHKQCTEIVVTITHPHHPDHQLTLCEGDYEDDDSPLCVACGGETSGFKYSCKSCSVDLHIKCIVRFPTHKHYLHEHNLVCFETYRDMECNRCDKSTNSPLFRCVPCNFNLHEECMELPPVAKHDTHVHPLTLRETYVEDDSGEYYCDHCAKRRDGQLGVYVCEQCKVTWAFHIECILPEIGKVYEKKKLPPAAVEKLNKQIANKKEEIHKIKEEVRTMTEMIEKARRELDDLVNQRSIILEGESENKS